MIKNVIFDLGRVIYSYQPREDMITLGYDDAFADIFMERVYDAPMWQELDRGTLTISEAIEQLSTQYPEMADDFFRILNQDEWPDRVITILPDSLEFFYKVKERGFGIYILSNFQNDLYDHCRARDPFFEDADGVFISAREGLIKPDPAIYHAILNRYNLKPKECVFIDDLPHNIAAAKAVGIHGIQFTTLGDVKKQFEELVK